MAILIVMIFMMMAGGRGDHPACSHLIIMITILIIIIIIITIMMIIIIMMMAGGRGECGVQPACSHLIIMIIIIIIIIIIIMLIIMMMSGGRGECGVHPASSDLVLRPRHSGHLPVTRYFKIEVDGCLLNNWIFSNRRTIILFQPNLQLRPPLRYSPHFFNPPLGHQVFFNAKSYLITISSPQVRPRPRSSVQQSQTWLRSWRAPPSPSRPPPPLPPCLLHSSISLRHKPQSQPCP